MSKKNRQKSRPAQRSSSANKAPAAVAPEAVPASAVSAEAATQSAEADVAHADPAPARAETGAAEAGGAAQEVMSAQADEAIPAADMPGAPLASEPAETHAAPAVAPAPFVVPTPAPMASQGDIRGVLIQVAGARLLMPNATIAEVLSYADPEPVGADAPGWLLGRLRWRGWQVPLIAFGTLAGVAEERAVLGSKVVVLKALAGTSRTPYFAMLTQGFPRLVTVSRRTLSVEDDAGEMPRGVQARVRLNEDPALLPDLEAIEALVADAVAQAA